MKGSRLYMIILVAALLLVFLFEYMGPPEFSWRETYDKHDKEPFGSFVFHDVLSSSVDDFSVTSLSFYQIFQEDSTASPRAFLLTEDRPSFADTDIDYMLKLICTGNRIMICTDHIPYQLGERLNIRTPYENYRPRNISRYIRDKHARDSIFFGTDSLHPKRIYEVCPHMHPTYLQLGVERWVYPEDSTTTITHNIPTNMKASPSDETTDPELIDSPEEETAEAEAETETGTETEEEAEAEKEAETVVGTETEEEEKPSHLEFFPVECDSFQVLAWNGEKKPLAVRLFIGKGEFYFVATPLMFTNYGILDGDNASYAFSLLSYLKDLPLVRIEAYGQYSDKPRTPLRYVLSIPALRWAIYATLMLLILFMVFTAKRRQRVIPVMKSPPNRSFGFMQLISNLYFQKHDNGEILKMKYTYFCAEVNKLTGLDFQERVPDESGYQRLAEKTGMDADLLKTILKDIQMAVYRSEADDTHLKQYIDRMNDILRAMYT